MNRSTAAALLLALALPAAAAGCGNGTDNATANAAADSVEATHSEGQLLSTFTDFATTLITPEKAAAVVAAILPSNYSPAGCATAVANGTEVTFTFDGCSGPRGLSGVRGTVEVIYAAGTGSILTVATASNLAFDSISVQTLSVQGTYAVSGSQRQLAESGTVSATGRLGTSFSRRGSYDLAWGTSTDCLALAGQWSTTSASKTWTTTVSGYDRCTDRCPAAGGQIDYTSGASEGVTITFDGTSRAAWRSTQGRQGKVELGCTE
jgi:hypothetical protein